MITKQKISRRLLLIVNRPQTTLADYAPFSHEEAALLATGVFHDFVSKGNTEMICMSSVSFVFSECKTYEKWYY
jgi:hypothetical protein